MREEDKFTRAQVESAVREFCEAHLVEREAGERLPDPESPIEIRGRWCRSRYTMVVRGRGVVMIVWSSRVGLRYGPPKAIRLALDQVRFVAPSLLMAAKGNLIEAIGALDAPGETRDP